MEGRLGIRALNKFLQSSLDRGLSEQVTKNIDQALADANSQNLVPLLKAPFSADQWASPLALFTTPRSR